MSITPGFSHQPSSLMCDDCWCLIPYAESRRVLCKWSPLRRCIVVSFLAGLGHAKYVGTVTMPGYRVHSPGGTQTSFCRESQQQPEQQSRGAFRPIFPLDSSTQTSIPADSPDCPAGTCTRSLYRVNCCTMAALRPARCLSATLLSPRPTGASRLSLRTTGAASARHKSGPYGYTQSKALVFSKPGEPADVLRLHTHSISPSIPSHSVLVRTLAAPVNPADVNTIQGTYGAKPTYHTLLGTPEPSSVPGNEGCLEVLAAGADVTTLRRGDWCLPASTGFGTWRTHALVDRADEALLRVDRDGLTPSQVATVSVNLCSAYRMLRDYVDLVQLSVRAGSGAWFIQNGANSGVGRAAVQLGRLWGLRSINVIRERVGDQAATEALRRELLDLGATVVVTESEFLDRGFPARMKDEFTRNGRDSVMLGLNCVGGKSATAMSKCLSDGGTLVTYGAMSKQPVMLPTGLLIFRDLRFHGFWLSRWANADKKGKKQTIDEILGLIREGKFRDAPLQEVKWDWETEDKVLREAVQGTLTGFRPGKGIFVFGDT